MQKRLVLVCEGSLCPRKLPDVSGPGLGEAGRYNHGPKGQEIKRGRQDAKDKRSSSSVLQMDFKFSSKKKDGV